MCHKKANLGRPVVLRTLARDNNASDMYKPPAGGLPRVSLFKDVLKSRAQQNPDGSKKAEDKIDVFGAGKIKIKCRTVEQSVELFKKSIEKVCCRKYLQSRAGDDKGSTQPGLCHAHYQRACLRACVRAALPLISAGLRCPLPVHCCASWHTYRITTGGGVSGASADGGVCTLRCYRWWWWWWWWWC